jgi:hypothetical protein
VQTARGSQKILSWRWNALGSVSDALKYSRCSTLRTAGGTVASAAFPSEFVPDFPPGRRALTPDWFRGLGASARTSKTS